MNNIIKLALAAASIVWASQSLASDATTKVNLTTSAWTALTTADALIWSAASIAVRCDATGSGTPSGGAGVPLKQTPLLLKVGTSDTCYGKAIGTAATVVVVPQS